MMLARFRCKTVTPMFMGNAEVFDVEIRPPSFIGMMRFWWRAMNSHLAAKGIDKLQQAEDKIFGGAAGNGVRSSFDLWVEEVVGKKSNADIMLKQFKPFSGVSYLFYILKNQNAAQQGYPAGTEFELVFSSDKESSFRKAIASFWLACHLGGFGARSRRGAGNIEIISESYEGVDPLPIRFRIFGNLNDYFETSYSEVNQILKETIGEKVNDNFSHLSGAKILIHRDGFNSWEKALEDIGGEMKKARGSKDQKPGKVPNAIVNKLDTDKLTYNKYKDYYHYSTYSLDTKAAFGLPIKIRNVGDLEFKNSETYNHRSSPIVISIVKSKSDNKEKYHWIVTHLQGRFMPSSKEKIQVILNPKEFAKNSKFRITEEKQDKLRNNPFPNENNVVLNYFLDSLRSKTIEISL